MRRLWWIFLVAAGVSLGLAMGCDDDGGDGDADADTDVDVDGDTDTDTDVDGDTDTDVDGDADADADADADGGGGLSTDPADPVVVTVGETVSGTAEAYGGSGPPTLYYFRFQPPETGLYSLTQTEGDEIGFCATENAGGCMCRVDWNCGSGNCTLEMSLVGGDPLVADEPYQVWIQSSQTEPTAFSFTITGPNT